jgi:hypothetical protein
MASELMHGRSQARELYVRALYSAYRSGVQLYDPSVWQARDPDVLEKMLRDADIAHAVNFRKHLIAGRQWDLVQDPYHRDADRARLARAVCGPLLSRIQRFTEARLQLAGAFLHGQRFARIHAETATLSIGDGKPRTWWIPVRLEDIDKRMRRIVPHHDGQRVHATWQRFDIGVGQWVDETVEESIDVIEHTYQDEQGSLGYGRGLLDALGWWWYAKEHVFAESLAACERLAQGIVAAKVDGARDAATGLPNEKLIRDWQKVLERLRSKHVLVYDKTDQVEVIQASGEGHALLRDIRDELRTTIHTLILGANITTAANKGGSYALAEVQENSTEALIQFDRESLEESLTTHLIGAIWFHNWANMVDLGIAEDRPRFNIRQEKHLDPQVRVAVAEAASRMGLPLALDEVYEHIGFRRPGPDDEVLQPRSTPAGADPIGMGLPGMGLPGLPGLPAGSGLPGLGP